MLTTKQAAKRLGYDPSHVRRLCINKVILANKHGRDWMISETELRKFEIEGGKENG